MVWIGYHINVGVILRTFTSTFFVIGITGVDKSYWVEIFAGIYAEVLDWVAETVNVVVVFTLLDAGWVDFVGVSAVVVDVVTVRA